MRPLPEMMLQRLAQWIVAAFAAAALAACSEDHQWNAKDVSGLMPDLQFELARAPSGERVTAADFQGKVTVVYFGFTHCPDVCPATLAKFSQALQGMELQQADQVRVLFVSVDPKRDTLERLAQYTGGFGERFVGLRGDEAYLRELTKRYRVTFGYGEPDDDGNYSVSHSNAAFIFDESGKLRLLARPDQSIEALKEDLTHLVDS